MTHLTRLALSTLFLFSLASSSWASEAEFDGYFRSGLGTNSKGGDQACFSNPGAGAHFRLGNECDEYGQLNMAFTFKSPQKEDPAVFNFNFMMAYSQSGQANWEESPIAIRQAYVEGEHFFPGPTKIWAGKRFYRLEDLHIMDFAYRDFGPPGAGLQDIPIGGFKLAVAYLKGGGSTDTDIGPLAMTLYDVQLYDINAGFAGTLALWLAQAHQPGGNLTDSTENLTESVPVQGQALGLTSVHEFKKGYNQLSIQKGSGLMKDLRFMEETFDISSAETLQQSQTLRIVEQFTWDQDLEWSMQAAWIRERRQQQPGRLDWQAIGGRFQLYLDHHWNLATEISQSSVQDQAEGAPVRRLQKFTIAPQLQLQPGFWERPVLRIFYTTAKWSQTNMGQVGGPAFAEATDGSSFGFQAELWF